MNTNSINTTSLLKKYNIPAPRYTSYPTVPFWQKAPVTEEEWINNFQATFAKDQSISLYIHLPYCESMCTFCGCNKRITKQHSVEEPYIRTLLKEWQLYLRQLPQKPIIKELHLGGGTPTFFQPENLKYLVEGILAEAERAEDFEFGFEAHPASTSNAHLETLYDLGFRRISIGVQDFDNEILRMINRQQPYEEVERVTKKARELGYDSINYDLVFGLPLQTKENIRVNINRVKHLKPDRIAFYSYAHVPWVSPGQRAYSEADLPLGAEKRALYTYGCELLEAIGYEEIGMDHFALPHDNLTRARKAGTLHRNFMGYTPLHTSLMIGLGASSISDSWTAYVQNVKKIEDYTALVEAEQFPIFRGHLLSEEDQHIRLHILQLMCQAETNFNNTPLPLETKEEILRFLEPMQKDGMVRVESDNNRDDQRVIITDRGLPFVRNICTAFDRRMVKKHPKERLFSQVV
jgi:oxygen-independent coproporphyrinogen-3 oxidase